MTLPRYACPTCGREVAATTPTPYSSPWSVFAYLRPHRAPDGAPCPTDAVTLARRLVRTGR